MAPSQIETPRIAKIMKKKRASAITLPRDVTESNRVRISNRMLGIVVKLFSGRKSLNVLRPCMFDISGISSRKLAITQVISSQFHGLVR